MIGGYLLLFVSAFLAATLLPASSEVALYALLQAGATPWLLLLVATLGNTLGSLLNWWLGQALLRFQDRRWFHFTPAQIAAAQTRFARYGVWTLLFAWTPLIGDALTLVAGVMRVPLRLFLPLVALGKGARYALILWLAS
ncbi:YqaA family protein [Marichromatium gracile]|uniref:Membrane protein YqaA with SNARE-associated domain n=1 Tax=Marichromatium gracile TaxID=1048 RepID=A0A4R4ACW1_MARGR|nr:YqaA family protein [Marichromatium gracile]MBK1708979.1 hypothetical protein [Marichromatium gracile]TCW36893.1 membrane protein YqaA with SNARE-associated domain [Marichromatium gracile]